MASFRKRKSRKGVVSFQARIEGVGSKTFTTLADARLWAGEMERKKRLGELYTPPTESFKQFLAGYVQRHAYSWRDSTKIRMRQTMVSLRPLEPLSLEEIDRVKVQDLVAEIASHAPNEAQKVLALVKRVLREAQERRYKIDPGVFTLKSPSYEPRPLRWLTIEEVNRLASWMPEFIHRIVIVAAMTGMRQGELFALKDEDLHLDEGYLWVWRGKTQNSRRKVHLGAEVVKVLREQLIRRPHTDDGLVFPAAEGGMVEKGNFMERYYRPARDAAGLDEHVTFHSLRHTFVSLAASQGVKSDTIAEIAGWSQNSWRVMYARYRHFFEGEAPVEAAKMDALLKEESA